MITRNCEVLNTIPKLSLPTPFRPTKFPLMSYSHWKEPTPPPKFKINSKLSGGRDEFYACLNFTLSKVRLYRIQV